MTCSSASWPRPASRGGLRRHEPLDGKALLPDGTHQQAGTNGCHQDEDDQGSRRPDVVLTRRRRTPSKDIDKKCCPSQPDADHVGAGLLWLASEPNEQKHQEDDRCHRRKGSGRERRVTEGGACKKKSDRGEKNSRVHTARISAALTEEGRTNLVGELDATPRQPDAAIALSEQPGTDQLLALRRESPRRGCAVEEPYPNHGGLPHRALP